MLRSLKHSVIPRKPKLYACPSSCCALMDETTQLRAVMRHTAYQTHVSQCTSVWDRMLDETKITEARTKLCGSACSHSPSHAALEGIYGNPNTDREWYRYNSRKYIYDVLSLLPFACIPEIGMPDWFTLCGTVSTPCCNLASLKC